MLNAAKLVKLEDRLHSLIQAQHRAGHKDYQGQIHNIRAQIKKLKAAVRSTKQYQQIAIAICLVFFSHFNTDADVIRAPRPTARVTRTAKRKD